MQRSKYVKRIIKAILFAALFVLFTMMLDMSFEYDEKNTEEMLSGFSEQTGLDTVFVGSSVGEMMDADRFSQITGDHAYNMCTPSQSLYVSLRNIKLAASQHKIKKAIMLTTVSSVNSDNYDGIDHIYNRVVDSSSPFHIRLKNAFVRNFQKSFSREIINKEQSVNIWIPWENEAVYDIGSIVNNIKMRWTRLVRREPLGYRIAYDLNTVKYETAPGTLTDTDMELFSQDSHKAEDLPVSPDMIASDKLMQMSEICAFCRDNDIEFIVVITPHRTDYYDRNDEFYENERTVSAYLNAFFAERGVAYCDAEDDETVHQVIPDEEYYDTEHVRDEFVDRSTDYLTEQITRCSKDTGTDHTE